ncbi:C40 family peptidase [Clostridium sp. YIM B02515]|uniref:C40 family peptidase n=1 Tax=Clostridium rhizosphaerae TaxID=2803861 RepID=A0ABS1T835_9CLOT|nr:C40 family peptidase [Clostridium rhizosphaerae]MBL4935492.1 C40 family peptidase [Clostridium rhizosphaerae]
MRLRSRITSILVCTALVVSAGTTVFADPTVDSLNQQKQQLEGQKSQYNQNMKQSQLSAEDAQKDIRNLNSQIQMFDSKIEDLNRNIKDTSTKIAQKEKDIIISQKNLADAEADIKNEQELFNKRMRAMYIAGNDQYISILLSSKSFNEFISNAQAVVSIVNFDKKVTKDLADKKEGIKKAKDVLENDRNQLIVYKQNNEAKLAQVKSDAQDQQKLIAEAKSRQAYYMSQVSGYKDKIAASDKQVQDTVKQLQAIAQAQTKNDQQPNRGNTGAPTAPASSNAVVAYAYKFLGCPYVWGAEGEVFTQADINMYKNTSHDLTGMEKLLGRQAFDCSGLMQYVYAHFGIHLTRTTFTQIHEGTAVDRKNLQPGDLIFFGTYSDPHHVGMYVGNNCYIEAPYSGAVVRISSLDDTDEYLCARRVMK